MNYLIDLENDENDDFERLADNVGVLQVFDSNGNEITKSSKVSLFLSKNALIGLGTELIRLAHNYKEGKHHHIDPASKEMMVQTLGVFLTPDSCELIVGCSDEKVIDDYFKD
ncbi:hypothetical protein A374_06211 [Fictibacillus macauensis ZFHKF-1]|uniref:Uncharacterized protein n=1 Tax=Fictibacillus macauensis ZFHKF-1 TaxID=1196324 RepID=I8UGZ2_9BACL|nr:hypothetical protein [Fictibacillus macauensis]EIT86170.1 hypothetical protein A374_06211 [Fictibacillus macauensis ZFHKF-1]